MMIQIGDLYVDSDRISFYWLITDIKIQLDC